MSELRWILLAAGFALIIALYVFGTRNRQKPTAAESERLTRVDPPRPSPPAESARREPRMSLEEEADEDANENENEADEDLQAGLPLQRPSDPVVRRHVNAPPPLRMPETAPSATRRETGLGTRADTSMRADPAGRETPQPRPAEVARSQQEESGGVEPRPATPATRPPQKIVAIRVTAAHPDRFDGALLREVITAARFKHGRYEIFHRLGADGRPVMSLASLLEPGTFDPSRMDTAAYPGIAIFTVMPGPLPGTRAFDELLDTARWMAQRLGGQLQDDRGAPLSVQRVFKMREEVVAFERSVGSAGSD